MKLRVLPSIILLLLSKLRKLFRVANREYLLSVKRGEQVLQLKIKLRRLI